MRLLAEDTKSFVVRIWREPRESEAESSEWRGWVEHVQSGERVYFRDLEESASFIARHLDGHTPRALRLGRRCQTFWKWVARLGWLATQ